MPWVIGLDEAGYGPNLGPLVQAASAVWVPQPTDCVWQKLASVVAKVADARRGDARIWVDDSKKVHAHPQGDERLERTVLTLTTGQATTWEQWLGRHAIGDSLADLRGESWFDGAFDLPWAASTSEIAAGHAAFVDACATAGIQLGGIWAVITPTPRFNAWLDQDTSKGAVLARGVMALLQATRQAIPGEDALEYAIDKQGGRHFYAPMLQTAFPDAWVTPISERASGSRYRLDGVERTIHLNFEPKADGHHWTVALASMVCKYLRELSMHQFNRFWQSHVSPLTVTAGYPVDAKRFYAQIQPAMARLGLSEAQVWRRK
ncbi:hypothetical protein : Uncharacterized protein OS=Planctomyces maris DSM 8797 GN=PM8797T_07342 PE=4 SV=1 [Tuwongella immobilis]|uniref:Uncharacterized protein n=2 Tax=Tuwongella immobilis TaxID=692036 RepID=A0A6C2YKA3_9BACT|nr:hypothetical protein : Uncharacterized protein OS=Planctomyces maris DSM 8797 GN=PM8797T_07342 PE=4 SV=1 [Tuwongella immobilis]VTR99510.1 hypothetical protein : Uncharacterized protein OS=Planctomyces maris DSM 8797 GN=PM8797T_07342 PE=4 SV=1 [Tuwongella immobilis]